MKKEIYELVLPEYTTPIPQEHIDVFCELRNNHEHRRKFYLLNKTFDRLWNVRNTDSEFCHYKNVPRGWFKKCVLSPFDEYIMANWGSKWDDGKLHMTKDEIRKVWNNAIIHYVSLES
jgi:hypothetical protein